MASVTRPRRNAQELVWHAMVAQVQLVFATIIGKLPADNIYFAKMRDGFQGALRWLDSNLASALRALPSPRDPGSGLFTRGCRIDTACAVPMGVSRSRS